MEVFVRYMMLIYTTELESTPDTASELERIAAEHRALMAEAKRRGVLVAADPLEATSMATTVRHRGGKVLTIDGPFAETKEQLAGYYIMDCADLDEAIAWAARMPTECAGGSGCVEIRPLRLVSSSPAAVAESYTARVHG
jgi:hypothetical protein